MGWGRPVGALGATAVAVLVPVVVVLALAVSADVAAVRVHAHLFHAGPWAWLGDATLVVDACAALALLGVPAALRRERVRRSGIDDVDTLSGSAFEERLAVLFADLGYRVTHTGARGDFGADLLLVREDQYEVDERVVVQAKRYDGTVGIEAVQQVIGATRYYDAERAVVVTNSTCTPSAVALAAAHGVELYERETLVGLLAAYPLAETRSPALSVLAREVGDGAVLVVFAIGALVRLGWWTCRAALRFSAALLRAGR